MPDFKLLKDRLVVNIIAKCSVLRDQSEGTLRYCAKITYSNKKLQSSNSPSFYDNLLHFFFCSA